MDRILYIDVDSLRPDHLGCYGYHRETSPTIDRLAADGMRFDNYYVSDAPCLPSRTALFSGRFGIHTGAVNHGGLTADPRSLGDQRWFRTSGEFRSLPEALRQEDFTTATISPFPSRHSAWHVLDGFETWRDTGGYGEESADVITPFAERWLEDHAAEESWFLHVNFWDPHIPYDTPESYGNPFADDPAPDWPDEETVREHYQSYGPHSAHDPLDFGPNPEGGREPPEISSREDFETYVDGYDVGIRYMDDHLARIVDLLKAQGVFEETLVVVSADHGENMGELNVYGDHQTPDDKTCRVPLIVHGPGVRTGVDDGFHYNVDLAPTLLDLVDGAPAERWDGESFAPAVTDGADAGREHVVVSQGAHVAGRGVRWDNWHLMRIYDRGVKDLDATMLFDLDADPHETTDLSTDRPEIVAEGMRILEEWRADRLDEAARGRRGGNPDSPNAVTDPLWTVVAEGGPLHTTGSLDVEAYCERLEATGRAEHAETVRERYR